jgi:hypothetical protein
MSKLSDKERLDLKKLLRESDVQDNTEYIRKVKHSQLILNDLRVMERLKRSNCADPLVFQLSRHFQQNGCRRTGFRNYVEAFNHFKTHRRRTSRPT